MLNKVYMLDICLTSTSEMYIRKERIISENQYFCFFLV